MFNSKVIRSLCLLLFFSLLLTVFGSVNVSAATNLINPHLNEWDNTITTGADSVEGTFEMSVHTSVQNDGRIFYYLQPTFLGNTGTDGNVRFYFGHAFDKAVLKSGSSYTFSMHILSPSEIRSAMPEYSSWTDSIFVSRLGSGYGIGFGVVDQNGDLKYITEFVNITQDNYLQLAGTDFVYSFNCPDYSGGNPCIFIMGSNTYATSTMFFDESMTLVDNSEEDEEGFFTRLFDWFQEKFDAIGDSFSNLGNKLSTGFTNLGDRIKTFFSDLGTSISNGLNSVKEGIQNKLDQVKTTLVELGESLINGIKSLFVPDEDYILVWKDNLDKLLQDHLGMIYTSANLVTDLVQKIFDIVFNAPESYGLTVPEVSFEILNGTQINLIPETEISFDFMENKTFKFIYGLYTVGLYIAFGVLEVKYGIRVYKKVMAN